MTHSNIKPSIFLLPLMLTALAAVSACSKAPAPEAVATTAAAPGLGIRPLGDETVKIDMTKIYSEDLKKVFGYWPAYLFAGDVMNIPIAGGSVGSGGNAHAANEYYVIEGAGKTYGIAGTEKSIVTALYNYAGKNKPAP